MPFQWTKHGKVPSRVSFQWTKLGKVSSKVPLEWIKSGNVLSQVASSGQSMVKWLLGCPVSELNAIKCPLGCPSMTFCALVPRCIRQMPLLPLSPLPLKYPESTSVLLTWSWSLHYCLTKLYLFSLNHGSLRRVTDGRMMSGLMSQIWSKCRWTAINQNNIWNGIWRWNLKENMFKAENK